MNNPAPAKDAHVERPHHIPLPVIVIACFELVRAMLIGWAAFAPMRGYSMDPVPISAMQVLTLDAFFFVPENPPPEPGISGEMLLADQKYDTAVGVMFGLPIAGYCLYLGLGLLLHNLKACALTIISSLFTVLFWLRGLLFSWAFQDLHQKYFTSPQAQSNVWLALLLNLLIFCYLANDEAVAHAYLPQRQRPSIKGFY